MKKNLKVAALGLCIIIIGATNILNAENMIKAIENSVGMCLRVIIPSLFGFMVLSGFLMSTGLHKKLFSPLYFVMRFVIRVSRDEFSILMLSLIGGYPVGAKLIAQSKCGEKLLPYCYCAAPVFLMGTVGLALYGDAKIGLYVYFANAGACLLMATISNWKPHPPAFNSAIKQTNSQFATGGTAGLISAVHAAAKAVLTVCSMIVFFSIVIETLRFISGELVTEYHTFFAGLFTFTEISNVTAFVGARREILPLIAALTSFGSVCMVTQIIALTKDVKNLSIRPFLLARIPAALISALICQLLIAEMTIEPGLTVGRFATQNPGFYFNEGINPIASIMLVIMAVILLKGEGS
ncbi:MAG: hypothetical protein FWH05_09630 [Oscillospiraceae bacterium]|nr:hypothetical protein [Oscillospiraceae bacterium]